MPSATDPPTVLPAITPAFDEPLWDITELFLPESVFVELKVTSGAPFAADEEAVCKDTEVTGAAEVGTGAGAWVVEDGGTDEDDVLEVVDVEDVVGTEDVIGIEEVAVETLTTVLVTVVVVGTVLIMPLIFRLCKTTARLTDG